jgi:hypothetical protein
LTQKIVAIRLLGSSRSVETPTASTIFCTGNNLAIAGDLAPRALMCSLNAKCEHPALDGIPHVEEDVPSVAMPVRQPSSLAASSANRHGRHRPRESEQTAAPLSLGRFAVSAASPRNFS